jgi:enoyl-CoA hydratase/carnithine racemase
MNSDDVSLTIDDPVAVIRITRPDSLNAFRGQTLRDLRAAFDAAERDSRVVGIVLTGEGDRAFCVGLDAEILSSAVGDGPTTGTDGWSGEFPGDPGLKEFQNALTFPMAVRKPVIGAINGMCVGGGLVLALSCDLRFADPHATFITIFAKRGLIAEHGVSWLLPRIVGPSKALDLLWSSRRTPAADALAIGLVDRVPSEGTALEAACDYVRELAKGSSPASMMSAKRLVYRHLSVALDQAIAEADEVMVASLRGPDPLEGATAFFERRDPSFPRLSFEAGSGSHA